jgi:hypothetical protein
LLIIYFLFENNVLKIDYYNIMMGPLFNCKGTHQVILGPLHPFGSVDGFLLDVRRKDGISPRTAS